MCDCFFIQGTQVLYPEFSKSSVPDPHLVRIRAGIIGMISFLFFFEKKFSKEKIKRKRSVLLIRLLNSWVLYPRFSRNSILDPERPDLSRILNYIILFFERVTDTYSVSNRG
jgi:hypothetical protein